MIFTQIHKFKSKKNKKLCKNRKQNQKKTNPNKNKNLICYQQAQLQVAQQTQINQVMNKQTVITTQGNTTDVNSILTTNIIQPTPNSFQLHTGKTIKQTIDLILSILNISSFSSLSGTSTNSKTNNNAAIISLLNSAPAAMTSSTVVNNLNTSSNSQVESSKIQSLKLKWNCCL